MMDAHHLGSYLNSHLSGAASAIEMLESWVDASSDPALAEVLEQIREDREVLRGLISDLDLPESALKQAAGWIGEKASRLPREVAKSRDEDFGLMLELEALQLGIFGKRSLWVMLQSLTDVHPKIAALPFVDLLQRADNQIEVVESRRVTTGRDALTTS